MGFVIHWRESAMELHVFPIPIPPPTSLSTQSLWVFPVHQARALVSCIQPGLVICFTLNNIHVSMLFSWNIPPSPSPTESKSLFCTSVWIDIWISKGRNWKDKRGHRVKTGPNQNRANLITFTPDSSVGKESCYKAGDPSVIPGSERSAGEGIGYPLQYSWASLVAPLVKNPPAVWETWVGKIPWRRERLPTPVFWPGEFHGLYSPWGCKESDMTEWLSFHFIIFKAWKYSSLAHCCFLGPLRVSSVTP